MAMKRKISLKWWFNEYKYLKSWSIYSDLLKKRRIWQGWIVFDKNPHSYLYAITLNHEQEQLCNHIPKMHIKIEIYNWNFLKQPCP